MKIHTTKIESERERKVVQRGRKDERDGQPKGHIRK